MTIPTFFPISYPLSLDVSGLLPGLFDHFECPALIPQGNYLFCDTLSVHLALICLIVSIPARELSFLRLNYERGFHYLGNQPRFNSRKGIIFFATQVMFERGRATVDVSIPARELSFLRHILFLVSFDAASIKFQFPQGNYLFCDIVYNVAQIARILEFQFPQGNYLFCDAAYRRGRIY